jgi:hypothetical protein
VSTDTGVVSISGGASANDFVSGGKVAGIGRGGGEERSFGWFDDFCAASHAFPSFEFSSTSMAFL